MNFQGFIPDLKTLDETRQQLYYVRAVLKESVHQYAKSALDNAQLCLEVAQASGPMVDTYSAQHQYNEDMRRCKEAMNAAHLISNGLLHLEETTDPDVDEANEDYKADTMELTVVGAMMEGAMNRMQMAVQSFPKDPRPGARCNGSIYTVKKSSESGGEDQQNPEA
jgi:hypothetical protein